MCIIRSMGLSILLWPCSPAKVYIKGEVIGRFCVLQVKSKASKRCYASIRMAFV